MSNSLLLPYVGAFPNIPLPKASCWGMINFYGNIFYIKENIKNVNIEY